MNISSWNVRGMNDPSKIVELKKYLSNNRVILVAFIETRVKENNCTKVQKKFGGTWRWETNYNFSPRGRIWNGWKHSILTFQTLYVAEQLIHGIISARNGLFSTHFTAVYGLHTIENRKPLWADLCSLKNTITGPWLVMGDFNAVLLSGDRVNDTAVTNNETRDFEECINSTDLTELKTFGQFFSWTNKGQGNLRICSRIDRAFGNLDWHNKYADSVVEYLNSGLSDHTPLIMRYKVNVKQGGRPFKFFNYMADHKDFLTIVQERWQVEIQGTAMFRIWNKLKGIKTGLKALHHQEFAGLEERIENIRVDLNLIQSQIAIDHTDSQLQNDEKDLSSKLKKFHLIQESAFKQKSRIQWLKLGDSNSKLFFSAMRERNSRNSIDELFDSAGQKLSTNKEITEEIRNFYTALIGTAASSIVGIDVEVVRRGNQLSPVAADSLVKPVTAAEIDRL
ncbi:uncharacterized protein [Spinacia oleracea]|uniref:Endonuclease/exonuclease/phosphatase domain-containing protein n=1 Tax=Spinacia oleracea TaxID=3562 RepID=A0A9R0KCL5_SPIOL|nr:uncharacterized protein LOC110805391 [Spinacia oleracea]